MVDQLLVDQLLFDQLMVDQLLFDQLLVEESASQEDLAHQWSADSLMKAEIDVVAAHIGGATTRHFRLVGKSTRTTSTALSVKAFRERLWNAIHQEVFRSVCHLARVGDAFCHWWGGPHMGRSIIV